ncbi:MAG: type II secretion system F family protein [Candidatus Thermoplasmatota archaeon]|nr:type II secretion system F family protein [Candidatus Thermoplasmatota archaeon]
MTREDLEQARIKMYEKLDLAKPILIVSGSIAAVLIIIAILNMMDVVDISLRSGETPIKRGINFIVFAMLVIMGPYGFYMQKKLKEVAAIEGRLPDFLRDVAEAGRFGMTLADAIVVASSGRYGRLTAEIEKMAAQIQWGVPASEALKLFNERVKTPMVSRVVSIIIKSSDAGGDVADVLTMVSHDAKETQLTEYERSIAMSTYIAVIYISFFVFLVTIAIINATFLPKMLEASESLTTSGEGSGGAVDSPLASDLPNIVESIKLAFFLAAIIHAVGDGLLAGVLDNGRVISGFRHSFLMLLIGFSILSFI